MRQSLTSGSLYERLADIYRNFFVNYPFVVSSPGGVIISGAFSYQYGGVGLNYRIPLRNYLGIKFNRTGELTYRHFGTYDLYKNSFVDVPDDEIKHKLSFLWDKINKKTNNSMGMEIGVLNEIPRRHGLNSPGVNAANSAIAYLLLTEQLTMNDLEKFEKDDRFLAKEIIELIGREAKEFHAQWLRPNSSGFGALACLKETASPIVYQMNRGFPVIKSLDEIFSLSANESSLYDVIIIGTSDRRDIDFDLHNYDTIFEAFAINESDIEKMRSIGFNLGERSNDYNHWVVDRYRDAADASAVASVIYMGNYLREDTKANRIKFFHALNNSYDSLGLVDDNFSRKAKASVFIKDYFYTELPDTPFAITTSIANHIILFVSGEHIRDKFDDLVETLNKKLGFVISYPYVSWRDGIEEAALKIEQWDQRGIFSDYLPVNSIYGVKLSALSTDPKVEYLGQADSLSLNDYDLIFNADEKRILINGIRVASNELSSVVATNMLMNAILESPELRVHNTELPDLSYFQDRNELQSKIISPLRAISEKYLHKSLNIKATGQILDFSVSLMPSDLDLILIKRK